MKKLLLSSIIMFGVCGFVTAQNAAGSKFKKVDTQAQSTSATATPQKTAAAGVQKPVLTSADGTVAAATNDVSATPADLKATPQTDADIAKKKELEKAAANKAATTKKEN